MRTSPQSAHFCAADYLRLPQTPSFRLYSHSDDLHSHAIPAESVNLSQGGSSVYIPIQSIVGEIHKLPLQFRRHESAVRLIL